MYRSRMPHDDRKPDVKPLSVRIPDACRMTGIGRSKLYELIKEGRIRTIKVGTATLIPVRALAEFLGIETY
jgi:excisionase family DNA binding protein